MNISSLTSAAAQSNQVVSGNQAQLGKEDFLRLLTVQLQYQDPLNPMENTEFIAQMAQFSSLEQLQNMNQSLEGNLAAETQLQDAFKNNLATSLIGKAVEVPTWEIEFDGSGESAMAYRLGEGAKAAKMSILDARGQLVREFELDAGQRYGSIAWDGRSDAGSEVPVGAYRVLVEAEDASGAPVTGEALKSVQVQAVRYGEEGARIWAGGQELSLEELSGVLEGNR